MYDLQKANSFKRISAFLFDIIIFAIVAVGCALLITSVAGYDEKLERYQAHYERYETEYGIDLDLTKEEYNTLSEAEKAKYDEADRAFREDERVYLDYRLIFNITLVAISLGILLAFLVLEFAIPIFLRNGQTLGKKIFGIGVMRVDGVRVTPVVLFIRSILGKYTIETMVPIFIIMQLIFGSLGTVGLGVLLLIVILEAGCVIGTNTNSMIHDLLSQTVTVDMASQMIFDSQEEMIAYKKRLHAELAERAEYK